MRYAQRIPAALVAAFFFLGAGVAGAADFMADRHVAREAKKLVAKGQSQKTAEKAACSQCHKESPATVAPPAAQCQTCHGDLDEVAKLTASTKPNPHYNHLGDVACDECHRGHEAPTLQCNTCHKLKLKTP